MRFIAKEQEDHSARRSRGASWRVQERFLLLAASALSDVYALYGSHGIRTYRGVR
jgi:hypothetical protein